MLNQLFKYLERPPVYTKSTCKFWDDEHVSKGLLEAHLNPRLEAASRQHDFIDKSVEWISEIAPSSVYSNLLDLGCGPGLYAERFYKKGYRVTGIDYSNRSINYAVNKAAENDQDIHYKYQNYLEIDYRNEYDLITLIYCDFVVLSDEERATLLKKIYNALKPGGKFIVDVFTVKEFEDRKESHTWEISENGGFWRPNKHLCLQSHFIYDNNVRLDQYTIIDEEGKVDVVRNWFKAYTKDTIIEEIEKAGFSNIMIYSDVAGKAYSDESKTICVVVEKQ